MPEGYTGSLEKLGRAAPDSSRLGSGPDYRYHGARRQIAEGTDHPNYKHGNRSQDAIKSFQGAMKALDEVEDMAIVAGMVASRRRGRRSR